MTTRRGLWLAMPRPIRAGMVRLAQGLTARNHANGYAIWLLFAFAALWSLSAFVRNFAGTLHGDMVDEYASAWSVSWSSTKHPPLIYWITAVWFTVMPVKQWSFYFLSCLNAAVGMWAVWLAATRIVDARRRVLAVAMLGLLPIFTFHAATFNHNTVQLSLWPLVALSFLVSVERKNPGWAIAFGVVSGLAVLGKYYSAWVILACALAALLHPDRRSYFCSARPYLAAAAFVAVIAPHLAALAAVDYVPLSRLESIAGRTPLAAIMGSVRHVAAYVAYLLPALLVGWLVLRPSLSTLWRGWPPMRRVVACIALGPIILPAVLFPLAGVAASAPWLYPAFFFAPLLIVSAPGLFVGRRSVAVIVGIVAAFAVVCVLISPLLMLIGFQNNMSEHVEPLPRLAKIATDTWRERTRRPLQRIGGTTLLADSIAFYSADHPTVSWRSYKRLSDVQVKQWQDGGVVIACRAQDNECRALTQQWLPTAERIELTLPVTLLWIKRPSESYVLYLYPGRG